MPVKITSIETLRTAEFANVIWVRVHTDARRDRTRRDLLRRRRRRGAYPRYAGRPPARPQSAAHRGHPPRHAEPADGAVQHRRRNIAPPRRSTSRCGICSARCATSRCIRCWAASAGRSSASTTPAPATAMSAPPTSSRSPPGTSPTAAGPYEDLNGFMTRADAVAESLLESGITAMKIWPFDPGGDGKRRHVHHAGAAEDGARAVREDPPRGRRQDGDHGRVPLAVEPADGQEDREGARTLQPDLVRGPDPHELAAGAGGICPLHQRLGLRQRDARLAAFPTRTCSTATPCMS